jgi:small subunit ribosomal protein S17
MLETEDNVNEDETPEEAAEEAAPEAPEAEAPAEEPAPEEEPAAEEAAPEEEAPAAEEEPAEEEAAPEAEAPAAAPAAADDEPAEVLSPKQRRKLSRSTHTGEARPERSLQDRLQERADQRARKAAHRRAYRAKQRERRAGEPRAEAPAPAPEEQATGKLKVRQGVVVSDRADKTITVRIDVASRHRKYKKIVRSSSTLHAHDEQNEAHIGDTVRLVESRPLSRTKRWRLVEVLERAK